MEHIGYISNLCPLTYWCELGVETYALFARLTVVIWLAQVVCGEYRFIHRIRSRANICGNDSCRLIEIVGAQLHLQH